MRLKLKTAPTTEPVTLTEAKNQLRIDGEEDNALITALIKTARILVEKDTKRALITQIWQMYLDKVDPEIEIPKPPLQSVESIKALSSVETLVDENVDRNQPILKVASTTGFAVDDTVVINRDGEREEEKTILSIQEGVSLTMTTNLTYVHMADQADKVEKYILVNPTKYYVDTSEDSPGRVKLKSEGSWPAHRNFASFIVEFKAGYGDASADVPGPLKEAILQFVCHLNENRESEEIPKGIKTMIWPYKVLRI